MSSTKPGWLLDLERDGYVVVPCVVPKQDCAEFREDALKWLEKFPHGFKRDDRSTWTEEHLPNSITGGLYNRYSVNHESFVWKIRTQPALVNAFEHIWGTKDLIASFDGINVTLPINKDHGRTDIDVTGAWPHMDQSARDVDRFELYQGIANLAPNGPDDGGLCILKGSHLKHAEFFAANGIDHARDAAGGYKYKGGEENWYRENGCTDVKVCAGEGDLILWDSRTIHWNASPVGTQTRFATYVCYCPRSFATDEVLDRKLDVFRSRKGTTHWPNRNVVPADQTERREALPRRPDGTVDPANRFRPFVEPEESESVLRLVGFREPIAA